MPEVHALHPAREPPVPSAVTFAPVIGLPAASESWRRTSREPSCGVKAGAPTSSSHNRAALRRRDFKFAAVFRFGTALGRGAAQVVFTRRLKRHRLTDCLKFTAVETAEHAFAVDLNGGALAFTTWPQHNANGDLDVGGSAPRTDRTFGADCADPDKVVTGADCRRHHSRFGGGNAAIFDHRFKRRILRDLDLPARRGGSARSRGCL